MIADTLFDITPEQKQADLARCRASYHANLTTVFRAVNRHIDLLKRLIAQPFETPRPLETVRTFETAQPFENPRTLQGVAI